jgi:hypothetical protein
VFASAIREFNEALALGPLVEKGSFFFSNRKAYFSASGRVDTADWVARTGGDELAKVDLLAKNNAIVGRNDF